MNKEDVILDYYKGNLAYLYFLIYLINGNNKEYASYILNKKNINAAKVGCISTILLSVKEDLIIKNKNKASSRIDLKYLELLAAIIAEKNNQGYLLDNYQFNNAVTLVSEIRNKMAHGNFIIDLDNNEVILIKNNHKIKVNINKLSEFVVNGLGLSIKASNASECKRDIIISNKIQSTRDKPIISKGEIRGLLNKFHKVEFTLQSKDNKVISQKAKNLLEDLIEDYQKNRGTITPKFINIENQLKKDYNFKIKNIQISKLTIDKLADYLYDILPTDNYNTQVKIVGSELQRYLDDKYKKINPIFFNLHNLILLNIIDKENTIDPSVIENKISNNNIKLIINYDSVAASTICMFNSLFAYALNDIYTNNNKFTNKDNTGLDFSKLDTSLINVTKNIINISPIIDSENKLKSNTKRLEEINNTINEYEKKLKLVEATNKNILKLQKRINNLKTQREQQLLNIKYYEEQLLSRKNYYNNNYEYLKNESIINGIRNSIAHGNYRVIFKGTIDKCEIEFEDIYNDKIMFKGKVNILDFINFLISSHNVIKDFISKDIKHIKSKSLNKLLIKNN